MAIPWTGGNDPLPYDMGNAGDLVKHGVLAEYVRWQCELGLPLRFLDPFGGEPWGPAAPEVARRVRALTTGALRAAQTGIEGGLYYGSGLVVRHTAEAGGTKARILSGDASRARRERLRASGLGMLDEVFSARAVDAEHDSKADYDGYRMLHAIVDGAEAGDLVLIDPFFDDFVGSRAAEVVPSVARITERAVALLFVLQSNPDDADGRRFDALLRQHLPEAWRVVCPPIRDTGVRGEATYYAEIVLAGGFRVGAKAGGDAGVLQRRLADYTRQLAATLRLPAECLAPRIVGY